MKKLTTPVFRGSFVNLLQPSIPPGGDESDAKYQITVPLAKDSEFIATVREACEQAAKDKFGPNVKFSDEKRKGHVWL